MAEAISRAIVDELKAIREDLDYIKHMIDADSILTEDDFIALQECRKEKKEGKLISHEKLKKELGL